MELEVAQIIAAGTFGTVCVVWDRVGERFLALKVLKAAHLDDPKIGARLRDEARLLTRIRHPNIVRVEGFTWISGRPVIAMEWVRGVALSDLLMLYPQGLPADVAIEIVRQSASALHAAYHTPDGADMRPMRVIHRDIKPSNLLLDLEGVVKVVDFGIARGDFQDKEATTVSMVLGARPYLAPERLDGGNDEQAGDVYALGFVLYELLTGELLQLSLHPMHHRKALEDAVGRLAHEGLSDVAAAELGGLVRVMCAYAQDDRPDHGAVASWLGAFQARHGLSQDLAPFADEAALPLFERRSGTRPAYHPAWSDLQFLGVAAAPDDADRRVRAFLAQPSWEDRLADLRHLLASDPRWSARPFVEVLGRANAPWWKRKRTSPAQLSAALRLGGLRPDRDLLLLAQRLVAHNDAGVVEAARALVGDLA